MSTVNISLPSEHVNLIDTPVSRYGFGTRSELVRSLIRLVMRRPELIDYAATYPFIPTPADQSVNDVMNDFQSTKKYSKAFLKDLEEGLRQSDYFKP